MKNEKPKIKKGQVWYCELHDHIIAIPMSYIYESRHEAIFWETGLEDYPKFYRRYFDPLDDYSFYIGEL